MNTVDKYKYFVFKIQLHVDIFIAHERTQSVFSHRSLCDVSIVAHQLLHIISASNC